MLYVQITSALPRVVRPADQPRPSWASSSTSPAPCRRTSPTPASPRRPRSRRRRYDAPADGRRSVRQHLLRRRGGQDRPRAAAALHTIINEPDQAHLRPGLGRAQGHRPGPGQRRQRDRDLLRPVDQQDRQRRRRRRLEPRARLGQVARRLRHGDRPGHRRAPPAPGGRDRSTPPAATRTSTTAAPRSPVLRLHRRRLLRAARRGQGRRRPDDLLHGGPLRGRRRLRRPRGQRPASTTAPPRTSASCRCCKHGTPRTRRTPSRSAATRSSTTSSSTTGTRSSTTPSGRRRSSARPSRAIAGTAQKCAVPADVDGSRARRGRPGVLPSVAPPDTGRNHGTRRDRHHRRRPGRPRHGYHLQRRGRASSSSTRHQRVGDNWRRQWDSLRLYSPAQYDGAAGPAVPAPSVVLPGQGRGGRLPRGVRRAPRPAGAPRRPRRAARPATGDGYVAAHHRRPRQLRQRRGRDRHLRPYAERPGVRRRARPGDPAAALERVPPSRPARRRARARRRRLALRAPTSPTSSPQTHPTILAGRDCGQIPFPPRVATGPAWSCRRSPSPGATCSPGGRRWAARRWSEIRFHGGPMLRVKRDDLAARGVERTEARMAGVARRPAGARRRPGARRRQRRLVHRLPAGLRLDRPAGHRRGRLAEGVPRRGRRRSRACSSAGCRFQYAFSSMVLPGVGRDADYVADRIVDRAATPRPRRSAPSRAA